MLKAIISGTLLAAATPAFAYAGYYQTEAGSNLNGHNNDAFAAAPATFTLPGITISNVATPVPTITIRASNACCGNTTGIGHWGYNFGVIGPDYAAVPLFAHIVAHGSAAAETVLGSALASAQIDIIPDARSASKPIHIFGQSRVNFDGQPDLPGFAIDEVVAFTLTANYNGFVAGEAVASVGTRAYNFDGEHPTYGTGSASVYLDPFISTRSSRSIRRGAPRTPATRSMSSPASAIRPPAVQCPNRRRGRCSSRDLASSARQRGGGGLRSSPPKGQAAA